MSSKKPTGSDEPPLSHQDILNINNLRDAVKDIRGFAISGDERSKFEEMLRDNIQQGKFKQTECDEVLETAEDQIKKRPIKKVLPAWIQPYIRIPTREEAARISAEEVKRSEEEARVRKAEKIERLGGEDPGEEPASDNPQLHRNQPEFSAPPTLTIEKDRIRATEAGISPEEAGISAEEAKRRAENRRANARWTFGDEEPTKPPNKALEPDTRPRRGPGPDTRPRRGPNTP